jgi:hypothetical protein
MNKTVKRNILTVFLIFSAIQISAQQSDIFPIENIVQVVICDNENVFSAVKEPLLNEYTGVLPLADKKPEFEGGIEALKDYFAANPLTDERANNLFFRVAIGFIVNCEGKAGNFRIVTKGKGDLEILANQVLEIVNNMPQNWKPATKKRKAVDCYQVLSFSILSGQLKKVSY